MLSARPVPILLACIIALLAPLATAGPGRPGAPGAGERPGAVKKLQIERFTLDNGMRVVVQPDHGAPLVAVGLVVDVGSRDEQKGRSGLAHFFEHMMFQGSAHVAKMEHFTALESVGARLNANTSTDRTYYYEVVPKGALELALWLEADRFASLKISKENVENQRQTVMEERRQSYGNRPYALSRLELRRHVFTTWPLRHSTIGSMADLRAAPLEAFEAFWQHWYTPNNVVLALVGDITPGHARELADRYLGKLERRAEPQKHKFAEPEPEAHVYVPYAEPLGKMPAFHLAWRVPAKPHPDAYAIDVFSELLDGSDAAPLRKKLTRETGIATRHFAGVYGLRDIDLFDIFAELSSGGDKILSRAKRITREVIYRIARDGVSAEELRRAKVSYEASYVFGIESLSARAAALCRHELYYGDANGFNEELARYRRVTPDDIVRVARKYFTWKREVEMDVLPAGMAPPRQAGDKPRYVEGAERRLLKTLRRRREAEERRKEKRKKREEMRKKRQEMQRLRAENRRRKRERAAHRAPKTVPGADKTAEQPGGKAGNKLGGKPGSKPGGKPRSKPGSKGAK